MSEISNDPVFEALKGNQPINLRDYVARKTARLKAMKQEFGKNQTQADQQFFDEKWDELRNFEESISNIISDISGDENPKEFDIHLLLTPKRG